MRTEACRVWEPADLFVDQRINPENCHVWPFADSFAIDVRFLVLDRRSTIPLHRPDHLEVVVFESGEQLYEIGNNICTLSKGDIIIVGNRFSHRCLPVASSRPPAYSTVLSFLPRTVHSGIPFGDDLQYLMPFTLQSPSIPNVIRGNLALSGEIRELIERIRVEVPASTEFSQLAIRTYLKMILLTIAEPLFRDRFLAPRICRSAGILCAPGADLRPYQGTRGRADPHQGCGPHVCRQPLFLHESLQAGDRSVLCRLSEWVSREKGTGSLGEHQQVDCGNQSRSRILQSELFHRRVPADRGRNSARIPPGKNNDGAEP